MGARNGNVHSTLMRTAGGVIKTSTYTYYVYTAFVFLLIGCGEEQMSKFGIAINHMINTYALEPWTADNVRVLHTRHMAE